MEQQTNVAVQTGITHDVTLSPLTVSRIYEGIYQKQGTKTAELRQEVKTVSTYPGIQIANDMQDNIFGNEEFDSEGTTYENVEKRVAWINVPDNKTVEEVQARLDQNEGACLYKVLSNKPILTSSQAAGITAGLTTKDVIAESQAVRFPENHENEGDLILDPKGKIQYRSIFFSATEKEDQDQRTEDPADFYATDAMMAELNDVTVIPGQELGNE